MRTRILYTALPLAFVALLASACTESSTGVSGNVEPSLDGGWTIGSGGRTDTTTTNTSAQQAGETEGVGIGG